MSSDRPRLLQVQGRLGDPQILHRLPKKNIYTTILRLNIVNLTTMTIFVKAKLKKSDNQTNVDKYRVDDNITEYHIVSKLIFKESFKNSR